MTLTRNIEGLAVSQGKKEIGNFDLVKAFVSFHQGIKFIFETDTCAPCSELPTNNSTMTLTRNIEGLAECQGMLDYHNK